MFEIFFRLENFLFSRAVRSIKGENGPLGRVKFHEAKLSFQRSMKYSIVELKARGVVTRCRFEGIYIETVSRPLTIGNVCRNIGRRADN